MFYNINIVLLFLMAGLNATLSSLRILTLILPFLKISLEYILCPSTTCYNPNFLKASEISSNYGYSTHLDLPKRRPSP